MGKWGSGEVGKWGNGLMEVSTAFPTLQYHNTTLLYSPASKCEHG
jgi:hypothetical protein